jgi:hypothetical protein
MRNSCRAPARATKLIPTINTTCQSSFCICADIDAKGALEIHLLYKCRHLLWSLVGFQGYPNPLARLTRSDTQSGERQFGRQAQLSNITAAKT